MKAFRNLGVMLLSACAGLLAGTAHSTAHPHVFVEANLEILRDAEGAVAEIRHVWRFDELFSSTVLLDFDENADGKMSVEELDAVSAIVTETIGEQGYFTQIRQSGKPIDIVGPEKILVEYIDGQVLMFFAIRPDRPVSLDGEGLRVAVSDPTYYVAMDILSEASVQISGNGAACRADIQRPDFDALIAAYQTTFNEQFFDNQENELLGDDWLTWIEFQCG